ncbi:hypothetical protein RB601_008935 [Gaeumannomyces tritici]
MQIKAVSAIFLAFLPILVSAAPFSPFNPRTHAGTYNKSEDGKCVCRPKDPNAIPLESPPESRFLRVQPKAPWKLPDPVCDGACVNGADCIIQESVSLGPACGGMNCPGPRRRLVCKPKAEGTK